jgi:hypothetical protein
VLGTSLVVNPFASLIGEVLHCDWHCCHACKVWLSQSLPLGGAPDRVCVRVLATPPALPHLVLCLMCLLCARCALRRVCGPRGAAAAGEPGAGGGADPRHAGAGVHQGFHLWRGQLQVGTGSRRQESHDGQGLSLRQAPRLKLPPSCMCCYGADRGSGRTLSSADKLSGRIRVLIAARAFGLPLW